MDNLKMRNGTIYCVFHLCDYNSETIDLRMLTLGKGMSVDVYSGYRV